jgi:hypothetical protein
MTQNSVHHSQKSATSHPGSLFSCLASITHPETCTGVSAASTHFATGTGGFEDTTFFFYVGGQNFISHFSERYEKGL